MDDDSEELTTLMIRDLRRSGIHRKHIETLQLETLTPRETDEFMGGKFAVPTYKIPYFTSDGKRTGYARLRNLKTDKRFSSGSHRKKKPLRYLQRANTAPHLYIPPVFEWPRNAETGKIEVDKLVITEGEKKAIKACLCGIPCVALGGVDSFQSSKRSIPLLEEFEEFNLTVTDIEVCYDSDLNTNADVRRAMQHLNAQLLTADPASIATVYLDGESTNNGKQGLDDFLKQFDQVEQAYEEFFKLPRKMDDRLGKLRMLDNEVCFLQHVGRLYNIPYNRYYDSAAALILDYGPKMSVADPENPKKMIPAAKLWLDTRKEHTWCDKLVYEPGKPKRYREEGATLDTLNIWRPSPVKPIEGDVTLWLKLVRYIMGTDELTSWFLQWLAYPLQKPGTKLLQSVFVYSREQGVGKNFVMEPLIRKIYGSNYQMIVSSDLEGDHNFWAKGKQMIFGEEIWMSDKRDREATMGKLKAFISNEYITVNEKYRPQEVLKNYAHLYITANQSTALSLDAQDRRFVVVHAPERKLPREFYDELNTWSHGEDAAGMVLSYLLNKVDIASFNPRQDAIMTEAKEEVVEYSRDVVQSMIAELVNHPSIILAVNGEVRDQELFTAGEVLTALNNYNRMNNRPEYHGSQDSIGRYLSNERVIPKRRMKLAKFGTATLYALMNKKAWKKRTDAHWHLSYAATSKLYRERRDLKINKREKAKVIDIATKQEISN